MLKLLDVLKTIPEYKEALAALGEGKTAAITGIGQINRSHIIAGLYAHTQMPLVLVCQDDLVAGSLAVSAVSLATGLGSAFFYALYSIFGRFALEKYSKLPHLKSYHIHLVKHE